MTLFNIHLDLEPSYVQALKDCYKTVVILVIFQVLLYQSGCPKNILQTALSGSLLNDDFIMLLIFVLIGIMAYYLVFEQIFVIDGP